MKSVVELLEIQSSEIKTSERLSSEVKSSEIRSLKDSTLLQRTQDLASEERRITAELIEHLREIERRKLYVDCGCYSLFNYCIKVLKLSEGSAQRRINALRLSNDVPELSEKLRSGEISLSVASQIQTFCRQESKSSSVSLDFKKALVEQVLGKSSRDAEVALIQHSTQLERHVLEALRPLSSTHSQVQFTVDQKQLALFERARGLLAHAHPQMNWSDLFTAMAQVVVEKLDPAKQASQRSVSPARSQASELTRTLSIPAAIESQAGGLVASEHQAALSSLSGSAEIQSPSSQRAILSSFKTHDVVDCDSDEPASSRSLKTPAVVETHSSSSGALSRPVTSSQDSKFSKLTIQKSQRQRFQEARFLERKVPGSKSQLHEAQSQVVLVQQAKAIDLKSVEAKIKTDNTKSLREFIPEVLILADLRGLDVIAAKCRRPSVALEREVWTRDDSQCVLCKSVYALEVDHIIPWAMGGLTTLGNVRLLCRSCNQRERVRWFGVAELKSTVSV